MKPPRLSHNVDIGTVISEMQDDFERLHAAYNDVRPPEGSTFHYCALSAACSIIEHECMWLTERTHLSDPSEVAFGLDIATRKFAKIRERNDVARVINETLLKKSLPRTMRDTGTYVCCFSMAMDSLEQWRMYADDARGVALEFDPGMMPDRPPPSASFAVVDSSYRMQYDVRQLIRQLGDMAEILAKTQSKLVGRVPDKDRRGVMESIHAQFATSIIVAANQFKHHAYAYEREWRLMTMGRAEHVRRSPGYSTRVRGGEIVHYLAQTMRPSIKQALRSVRIGPAANLALVDQMQDFLARHGLSHLPVIKSTIPYRSVK